MTIEPLAWLKNKRPDLTAVDELDGGCGVKECQQPQLENLPVCETHAIDITHEILLHRESYTIANSVQANIRREEVVTRRDRLIQERINEANRERVERKQRPGIIYYLRLGEWLKVGFTTDLTTRLQSYPPMVELLATHPGTLETERHIQAMFDEYRAKGREWFHHNAELLEHVAEVRETFPQKNTK